MGKVVVTGATGRLGANVVKALVERGDAVRCLVMPKDLAASKLAAFDIEVFEADLRDADRLREAVRSVDKVCHFATLMDEVPEGMSNVEYFDINTRGSYALMDAAQAEGVEKFVYTSSTSVYDVTTVREVPTREDAPLRPHSEYGITKVAAEAALMAMSFHYDLPLIILRPSYIMAADQVLVLGAPGNAIFGLKAATDPHSSFYVPDLGEPWKEVEEKAKANPDLSVIPYGPGRVPWQWHVTDVRDCVQAVLLSLDTDAVECDIFNLAGPPPRPFDEVVKYKCEKLGTPYEEVHTPVTWRLEFDVTKARELLGYEPEYDVFRMIDDAIAFRKGEDIGVNPA